MCDSADIGSDSSTCHICVKPAALLAFCGRFEVQSRSTDLSHKRLSLGSIGSQSVNLKSPMHDFFTHGVRLQERRLSDYPTDSY